MRWLACVVFMVACGGKPPPPPKAAELEVTGPASFAGSWVTADDLDWGYTLQVEPDGKLLLTIDRGKMGRCEQKGTLQPGANPRTYQIVYAKDTCNPDYGGTPLTLEIASFTGTVLTVAVTGAGKHTTRTYQRDPKSAPAS